MATTTAAAATGAASADRSFGLAPATGLSQAALVATYLAAAATPWNGWFIGALLPGDALLLVALLLFLSTDLGQPWPKLPPWAWAFGGMIVLVTVAHELLPTDPLYLAQRLVVDPAGQSIPEIQTNLQVGGKFLVPIVGMPLVFLFARLHDTDAVRKTMISFAAGSAISAVLAEAQVLGVTSLASSLKGQSQQDAATAESRAAGLAVHPNFLAMTCVISIPFAFWLIARMGRDRVIGLLLLAAELVGIYASGSRGGAAVAVLGVVGSLVIMPTYRRALPIVAFALAGLAAVAFVVQPSIGHSVLKAVRLTGDNSSAAGSDFVRAEVGAQGLSDFKHSPIDGVGMQVAAEAHDVYIQTLASGGLLLLLGLATFIGGGLLRSGSALRSDPAAQALLVASLCTAALASLENSLTDRLAYVPFALCATLVALPRHERSELNDA